MKNVYVADDDADDAFLLTEAAKDACPELEITCSSDGYSLLDTLHKNTPPTPDLIFLDINMPRMGGLETISKLKETELYKGIPIIVYSTSSEREDVEAMYKKGAFHYIKKPTSYGDILKIMEKICVMDFTGGQPPRNNFIIAA